jgi:hypothetical protein
MERERIFGNRSVRGLSLACPYQENIPILILPTSKKRLTGLSIRKAI